LRVYWFRGRPNYGDALAPLLVERFSGIAARWAPPPLSDGVVIGSLAGRLPRRYYGVVVGIGKFSETSNVDLSHARVLGLRGLLTLKDSRTKGDPVLGDPGLLVAELLAERPEPTHELGIVPHLSDNEMVLRYPDAHFIDVGDEPLAVTRAIASCKRIVSSSLHGLVAADALGIERRWELSPGTRSGGAFKFRDYGTALGIQVNADAWATAPAAAVESVRAGLRDVFREIPTVLAQRRFGTVERSLQVADAAPSWVGRRARRIRSEGRVDRRASNSQVPPMTDLSPTPAFVSTSASASDRPGGISAVVPMYNASRTILRTLESITAQTRSVDAIVVVDDHSTDDSRALVEAAAIPNLELISTPRNSGPGAARNTGIRHARTEWVALLDSDDLWMPTFVEDVTAAITRFDADFGSAGGQRIKQYRDRPKVQKRAIATDDDAVDMTANFWRTARKFMPVHSSAVVLKKSLFEKAGGFPEDMRNGEDVSLWMRLWLFGRFAFVNKPLFESSAVATGLAAGKLRYADVRRGLWRMAVTLKDAIRMRRPGTGAFAIWFIGRIFHRHGVWLAKKIRHRGAVTGAVKRA
jgi:glycosyltransferase involved in cell wall biosynthesis